MAARKNPIGARPIDGGKRYILPDGTNVSRRQYRNLVLLAEPNRQIKPNGGGRKNPLNAKAIDGRKFYQLSNGDTISRREYDKLARLEKSNRLYTNAEKIIGKQALKHFDNLTKKKREQFYRWIVKTTVPKGFLREGLKLPFQRNKLSKQSYFEGLRLMLRVYRSFGENRFWWRDHFSTIV